VFDLGGFVEESFVAFSAGESLTLAHRNVGLSMLFEIGRGRESLSAFGTLEGLFTSVDFLVSLEVGDLSKSLVASLMVTLIRLLAGMDPQVFLQR
jgi:hypothetical protein